MGLCVPSYVFEFHSMSSSLKNFSRVVFMCSSINRNSPTTRRVSPSLLIVAIPCSLIFSMMGFTVPSALVKTTSYDAV